MKSRSPNLFLLIWLWAFAAGRCAAYEFTVEGEIKIRFYDNQGQVEWLTNYNFTAEVRDCSSRIRISGGTFSASEFNEYGWDTTNSYKLIKFWANRETKVVTQFSDRGAKTINLDKPIKPMNDATLALYTSELPQYGLGMEPVWLAYASPCYYQNKKSGTKIEPIWRINSISRAETKTFFKSEWRMNKDAPQLLEFMYDFTDGMKYDVTGRQPAARMPKPFDVETTNSIYQVLSWTNVAGMILPDRFQVVHYSPDLQATPPALHITKVYEGMAQWIRPTCATTDFSPKVANSTPTQIYDNRLARDTIPVTTVPYFSPTGKVANLEELKKTDAYAQALKIVKPKIRVDKMRPLVIGLFLVASIFPIWILVRGKWGENKPSNTVTTE